MDDIVYKAMADATRREIVSMLKWKNMNAGDIAGHFEISKPSISRHLDVLENAKLITSERRGNQIVYSLNVSVVQEVLMAFIGIFDTFKESSNGKQD
ncbi:MAG: winged helix-turn-helix transcriptional regulator [Anaerolineae bacterium]|nr:winged helix-turn-helix transcriptional regulator [Anaerolineae bacterium]